MSSEYPERGSTPSRAGQYADQPEGYRAFIPAPLPPDPPIDLSKLQVPLSNAHIALGRLDGAASALPNPERFVHMFVRKEAVLSSQIEGLQSTLQDLLASEAQVAARNPPRDVGEVANYVRATNHGLAQLDDLLLSLSPIRQAHAQLLQGVSGAHLKAGELRSGQNWIGAAGSTIREAIFVPPPAEEVPKQLAAMGAFLHNDRELPALIKIGLAHAQFETIHPFFDGNGRIGRMLITFLLRADNTLSQPVLYLSQSFLRQRRRYYAELQSVRDNGSWEQWLAFFLRAISEASVHTTETVCNILLLREQHKKRITEQLGRAASNGHRVLEHMYNHPILSVKDVQQISHTTNAAANTLVSRLAAIGILREITGYSRHRRFRYEDYTRLFHDPDFTPQRPTTP